MESTETQPILSSSHHHERTLATPLDDLGSSSFPPLYPRPSLGAHPGASAPYYSVESTGPAASASAIRKYIPPSLRGPWAFI